MPTQNDLSLGIFRQDLKAAIKTIFSEIKLTLLKDETPQQRSRNKKVPNRNLRTEKLKM